MLRPERLQLVCGAASGEIHQRLNLLRGVVRNTVYQGDSFLLQVGLAQGGEIGVRGVSTSSAMAALPQQGEEVTLGLEPDDTILVSDEGGAP